MVAQIDREYASAARTRTIRRLVSHALFEGRPATTRAQWINPLVLTHLRLAARFAPCRAVDRPIFIVGIGRSGTTHLGRLLSVHKDVGYLNEPKALWHVIDPAEDVSGILSRGTVRFRLTPADVDGRTRQRANRLLSHYASVTRSRRVVDKYPELTYRCGYLRELYPGAIVVAIVRRCEAVVSSIATWSAQHRTPDQDWWGVRSQKWTLMWEELVERDERRSQLFAGWDPATCSDRDRALVEWIVGMDELTSTDRSEDGPDLIVRYEDLAAMPAETLTTVLEVAELAPDTGVINFATATTTDARKGGAVPMSRLVGSEVGRLHQVLGYGVQ